MVFCTSNNVLLCGVFCVGAKFVCICHSQEPVFLVIIVLYESVGLNFVGQYYDFVRSFIHNFACISHNTSKLNPRAP